MLRTHHFILLPLLTLTTALLLAQQTTQPSSTPYLHMPQDDTSPLPPLLSQTGAFTDTKSLTPSPALIPYTLNHPFYSDGATKTRYLSLPQNTHIHFTPTGPWTFPDGTVFIKHFDLPATMTSPARRLETRVLIRDRTGFVYGASYKWRPDNSDADLLTTSSIDTVQGPDGPHPYYFPGPKDCRTCHTPASGGVLGVNTRQLNTGNQLQQLAAKNLFDAPLPDPATLPHLVPLDDATASLEFRVRSWLDANCAQCHQPSTVPNSGAVPDFDARFDIPFAPDKLNLRAHLTAGIDHVRLLAPNDPWRSAILTRIDTTNSTKMPPLGRETIDKHAVDLLRTYITSLPGPEVLPPPSITPSSTDFTKPLTVTLTHPDPAAAIHYTLDGTAPTAQSPTYTAPLLITPPTIVRATAVKSNATPSIAAQRVIAPE